MQKFSVDKSGFYGESAAYIPEILHRCVTELQDSYLRSWKATPSGRSSTGC